MTTVLPSDVTTQELAALESAKESLPDGSLKNALNLLHDDLARGETVLVVPEDTAVTPTQAAQLLGLSRTHLYKVLDSNALPFFRVGEKDRRILIRDLIEYRESLHRAQKATAAIFAGGSAADDDALDEMS